jgi:hypothetical protein
MPKRRIVICQDCKHAFPSNLEIGKARCGKCGSLNIIEASAMLGGREEVEEATQPKQLQIIPPEPIRLDAEQIHLAQQLINDGLGKNLKEIIQKALQNYGGTYYYLKNIKGEKMVDEKKITMEDIMVWRALKEDLSGRQGIDPFIQQLILLNSINRGDSKKDNTIEYILPLILLQQKSNNSQQNYIDPLLLLLLSQPKQPSIDPMILLILLSQKSDIKDILPLLKPDKSETVQLLTSLEQIRSERDKALKEKDNEIQKIRDQVLLKELDELRRKIDSSLQSEGISQKMREKIDQLILKNFEEAATNIEKKGEKSTGDIAKELIEGTIERIKQPILEPLGQALATRIASQQQSVPQEYYIQQQIQQEPKEKTE